MKDNLLKENVFVFWSGTGNAGDQQWTFHRPIGETLLKASQWVATPTRDIGFLLMRRESEALAAWKRQAELAKRQAVLRARQGRKYSDDGSTEVWTFADAPAIQPTIRTCMAAAKAAGANESAWLDYADRAVQTAERTFKEALKVQSVPTGWLRGHTRPAHETKGGALGDQPQKAVPYLNGLSLASARDKVTRVAIGVDSSDPLPVPEDGESSDEGDEAPPRPAPSPPRQGSGEKGKAPASPKGGQGIPSGGYSPKKEGSPAK